MNSLSKLLDNLHVIAVSRYYRVIEGLYEKVVFKVNACSNGYICPSLYTGHAPTIYIFIRSIAMRSLHQSWREGLCKMEVNS